MKPTHGRIAMQLMWSAMLIGAGAAGAAEKADGPFEVTVRKVESVAELGGKKASRGQFICVQFVATNRSKDEEQFVPAHLVVDPVGSQTAESLDASRAYEAQGWKVDRPKFSNFKAGQSMNLVACFDAAIGGGQKGRLTFAYGGYGAAHPAWKLDVALPMQTSTDKP